MKEDEDNILVKVEGLSKKFCKDLKTSLWYGVKDLSTNLFGNQKQRQLRPKEFWALKDINFELRRGECLGLIGHNGAGKSTLLKILNGLIKPDEGKVTIKGRVGALIELGAGFNPILTGRENIYNNGAVLGFTRAEIDAKVDAIIDFAEIREFIDMPVQNYSSGMKVRLGFAVAAQMEPDVLIIDEVLAVGDVGFKLKCFNVLEELIKKCAVIIVSHSMPQVTRISTEIILMERGVIVMNESANSAKAIEEYYKLAGKSIKTEFGNGSIEIQEVAINGELKEVVDLEFDKSFKLGLKLRLFKPIEKLSVKVTFYDVEQKPIAQLSSINDNIIIHNINLDDEMSIDVEIEKLFFNVGVYSLHLVVRELNVHNKEVDILSLIRSVKSINVIGNTYYSHSPCLLKGSWKNNLTSD
ncbi:ABC transporter ATP-binding protein [Hyunsoonleella aestuarii]|uniref:ABC transporter domain-containing protein n=1 Tax=Hyunsoonleella aestuarii TaxID=912802 RepID=A0ABP8E774_9FLAO|nr:ABC transporter ATP-binding protein [Hyunsoonleella aestuarii]